MRLPILLAGIYTIAGAQGPPTAQRLVDAALAKAARLEKNVFVVFHSPR
jgi:hypothetical protein